MLLLSPIPSTSQAFWGGAIYDILKIIFCDYYFGKMKTIIIVIIKKKTIYQIKINNLFYLLALYFNSQLAVLILFTWIQGEYW